MTLGPRCDSVAATTTANFGVTDLGLSVAHILVVLLLIVLLFGTGKISSLMGDVAKGIKSFKRGLSDDDETPPRDARLPETRDQA